MSDNLQKQSTDASISGMEKLPRCPHDNTKLQQVDPDAWYCRKCGDEWPDEVVNRNAR